MKRKFKALMGLVLAALLLLPMALTAQAAVTSTAPHYLEVKVKYEGVHPIANVGVRIHKVADFDVKSGTYQFTPRFASCGLTLPSYEDGYNQFSSDLVTGLYTFATDYAKPLEPDIKAVTNAGGQVRFTQMEEALYLVSQDIPVAAGDGNYYCFNPFLISIPMKNENAGGNVSYGITCSPKAEKVAKPIDVEVKKVWANVSETSHPKEITVQLTGTKDNNKTVFPQEKLNKDNGWHIIYPNLPSDYKWSVVEVSPPSGYKVTYSSENKGNTLILTVTNTKENIKKPPLIQTGQLNWPVPVMVVLGLALMGAGWGIAHHGKKEQ